jgi:hypothetical protein
MLRPMKNSSVLNYYCNSPDFLFFDIRKTKKITAYMFPLRLLPCPSRVLGRS